MKKISLILVSIVLLTSCTNTKVTTPELESNNSTSIDQETEQTITSTDEPAKQELTNTKAQEESSAQTLPLKDGDIVATMKTTSGTMKIKLFQELVPHTVNNFIVLAQDKYYDGIIFHRVIENFMIQGGDPTGTGMGGESIYGAKFNDEFSPELSNIKYSISMANSGENTNGSQFFINQNDNINLDFNKQPLTSKHTVFGQVVEGQDIVDIIAGVKTGAQDKPEKEIKIESILIQKYKNQSLESFTLDKEKILSDYIISKKEAEEKLKKEQEAKKNKNLETGDIVSVHYTLTLADGTKKDSSLDRGTPFEFKLGAKEVIPGWDTGLLGHKIGDTFKLEVEAKDAYGEYDKTRIQVVPREELKTFKENGIILKKGNKLPTQYGEFLIKEANDTEITLDVNHPLAGEKLFFDIEVLDIK